MPAVNYNFVEVENVHVPVPRYVKKHDRRNNRRNEKRYIAALLSLEDDE
jgi:hypothetical protein